MMKSELSHEYCYEDSCVTYMCGSVRLIQCAIHVTISFSIHT